MSGNTFRPPWVKDGPSPSPATTVPWRTKDKTVAVSTASDQPNAVYLLHIYAYCENAFYLVFVLYHDTMFCVVTF